MNETVDRINAMDPARAREALVRCAGSGRWADWMVERRPFASWAQLVDTGDALWSELPESDVLEAISHHPRIGADLEKLRAKLESAGAWSASEQAGIHGAPEDVLIALRDGNVAYEERFGHIFIVCAAGKSAGEMLDILRARLDHDPTTELEVTRRELAAITKLRLEKL